MLRSADCALGSEFWCSVSATLASTALHGWGRALFIIISGLWYGDHELTAGGWGTIGDKGDALSIVKLSADLQVALEASHASHSRPG